MTKRQTNKLTRRSVLLGSTAALAAGVGVSGSAAAPREEAKVKTYTFGEGEPTPELFDKIPPSQRDIVKSRHCTPLGIDELADLNRLTAWHFMVAGPEGALVTEYGTFHDMDGLRFSNPKATL